MITPFNIRAIYKLYPQIANTTDTHAYDASGNEVIIDFALVDAEVSSTQYQRQRAAEYPDFKEYLDGIVKGDQTQIADYIAKCQAVKNKYPKEQA